MNGGKIVSGIVALAIYLSIVFLVLFFYNIHQTKAKNYVEKNSDRVTVTLVNSDKTVFNRSDKVSTPKKPAPVVKKKIPKKHIPKKVEPKKVVPKKIERASKPIPKPKRVVVPKKPKKTVPKKIVPKKHTPKKVVPKKPKKIKVHPAKKKIPKKPKKSAKDLFSSIKTRTPVKKVPKKRPKQPVHHRPSSIKHNSSITDRIRATHQSGRVSNVNRERGVENAYIAKVKQRMNNWNAVGMRGQWVTINLTIFQSGRFKYRASGVSGAMRESLTQYMKRLNSMGGLGRHTKSTPYSIQVRFRVN